MPHFIVIDHNGRDLNIYTDLKTNAGAERRAKRHYPTATVIQRWDVSDNNPRPYYNPDNKPNVVWHLH